MTQPIQDLRQVPRLPKFKRGVSQGKRATWDIVGITWHQTASGSLDATHPKLLNIPAHIILHRDGTWTWLHDFEELVYHGHALNNGTVGVEIDARAAGIEGDPRTFWRSAKEKNGYTDTRGKYHPPKSYAELVREATDEQLAMVEPLMRFIDSQCQEKMVRNGQPWIRANWAHRQGHHSRTSDPGSRIWRAVKQAEARMGGLKDVQDMALGSGKPIPKEWRLP